MTTVLVTGVNGFVGTHLAVHLAGKGMRVIGSTSTEAGRCIPTPGVVRKVLLRLGDRSSRQVLDGIDTVIHCAWDLRPGLGVTNVDGTMLLIDEAAVAGVTHQIFISTSSAHEEAVTEYGRTKLEVQRHVLQRGHTALRLGLTIGSGGLFWRLFKTLSSRRVAPLLDGGRSLVPILAIADLQRAVADVTDARRTGLFNMFNPSLVPMRDIINEIRAAAKRPQLLVPVPSYLLLGPVWLAGRLGFRLPIDADNIRAMRANDGRQERSDLTTFVPHPMTLRAMVREACGYRCDH